MKMSWLIQILCLHLVACWYSCVYVCLTSSRISIGAVKHETQHLVLLLHGSQHIFHFYILYYASFVPHSLQQNLLQGIDDILSACHDTSTVSLSFPEPLMTLSRAASCPRQKKSRRITQTELNHCSSLLQLIVTIILILYSCQVCVQFYMYSCHFHFPLCITQ